MTFLFSNLSFYFFLFLLVCGMLSEKVCASGKASPPTTVNPFKLFTKEEKMDDVICPSGNQDKKKNVNVKEYYSPFLLSANNIFFAVVGVVNCTTNEKDIIVLTKYAEVNSKEADWGEKFFNSGSSNSVTWKKQLAAQKTIQNDDGNNVVKGFVVFAKDKNIYLLLVNCGSTVASSDPVQIKCEFQIDVGTVADTSEEKKEKTLWKTLEPAFTSDTYQLTSLAEKTLEDKNFIFGSAFLTEENKIIFVVNIKSADDKYTTVLVRSENTDNNLKFLSINDFTEKCHSYIFPWNEKIIKLNTGCNKDDETKLEESINMGADWSQSQEPLFRLAKFLKNKKDFITAITDKNKKFILFTQDITAGDSSKEKDLWMSDGTRAIHIGKISYNFKDTTFYKLFYIDGELFLITQSCEGNNEGICLTHLKEQMVKINDMLTAWESNENKIEQLCKTKDNKKRNCNTDGLVGFLVGTNNKINNQQWKDEYSNNIVKLTSGTKIQDSFTFNSAGAGAMWTIEKQTENQPYNFVDPGFTLLAIVTVGKVEESNYNSILGVGFSENEKTISLLCSNDGKWVVGTGKNPKKLEPTTEICERDNTYQVMLILENETVALYINGYKLGGTTAENIKIKKSDVISYFYFGAENEQEQNNDNTNVTIENVLLYNRPFNSSEIANLKIEKQESTADPKKENSGNNISGQQSSGNSEPEINEETVKNNESKSTPDTLTGEVVSSSTQQRESAVGNSVNVIVGVVLCSVLYLMLEGWDFYVFFI